VKLDIGWYVGMSERLREAAVGGLWPGFCKACSEESDVIETDARGLTCVYCGEPQVIGAAHLMEML
jgi:hypothetical protein